MPKHLKISLQWVWWFLSSGTPEILTSRSQVKSLKVVSRNVFWTLPANARDDLFGWHSLRTPQHTARLKEELKRLRIVNRFTLDKFSFKLNLPLGGSWPLLHLIRAGTTNQNLPPWPHNFGPQNSFWCGGHNVQSSSRVDIASPEQSPD